MNILFEGFFYSGTGYAEGNRVLLLILNRLGYHVRISPLDTEKKSSRALSAEEMEYLSLYEHNQLSSNDMFISRASGPNLRYNPDFRINIGLTTFETDRFPSKYVPLLNRFDEVWVQTDFNKGTFRKSGVHVPLKVLPYFFNDSQYSPEGPKYPLPLSKGFVFLSIFDLIERKGYDLLLDAYLNEFTADDEVSLLIKTRNSKSTYKLIEIIESHSKPKKERPYIHIIDKMLQTDEILSLYRASNAFVLPTRGEGWGRPFFESMLMERPVIGTDWSGQRQYMNEDNSFLVRVDRLVPVKLKDHPDPGKYEGHLWAEPSIEDLQHKMRYTFQHPAKTSRRGREAREYLMKHFSMENAMKQVAKRIEAFRVK